MGWININLDEELHRKAKAISATRGISLKDYLAWLIAEGVEKDDTERE